MLRSSANSPSVSAVREMTSSWASDGLAFDSSGSHGQLAHGPSSMPHTSQRSNGGSSR